MLYNMKALLDKALKGRYAVMAPSVRNEDCARAAMEAAEELESPLILNVNRHAWAGMHETCYWRYQTEVLRQIADRALVPVAINLDHAPNYEECVHAITAGFTAVMIDHSDLPFDENAALTAEVVKVAHAVGVSVEAELGHVGFADPESLVGYISEDDQKKVMDASSKLTVPDELKKFIDVTGVDCVAVSIGNQHGAYKSGQIPHIDFNLLDELGKTCPDVPLVLHGGSGTGDGILQKACRMGICKVNVGTECEKGAAMAIVDTYNKKGKVPAVYDVAREGYKAEVHRHIRLFGSEGKAW